MYRKHKTLNGANGLYNHTYPTVSSSWVGAVTLTSISTLGARLDPDADTLAVATENSPPVLTDLGDTLVPTQDIGPFFAGVFLPDLHAFPSKRYKWAGIRDEVVE